MREIKRSQEQMKIGVLFDIVKDKVDKEKNIGYYLKNMSLYAGIGIITSMSALQVMPTENQFAYVALSAILASAGAIAGAIKSMVDEKKEVNSVMATCIHDISTRENLIPLEKVVLNRYLQQETLNIKEIVKDNIIKSDLDQAQLKGVSTKDLVSRLKTDISRFTKDDIADNIKYQPEYVRDLGKDIKGEITERIARIASFQNASESEIKTNTQVASARRLSM